MNNKYIINSLQKKPKLVEQKGVYKSKVLSKSKLDPEPLRNIQETTVPARNKCIHVHM